MNNNKTNTYDLDGLEAQMIDYIYQPDAKSILVTYAVSFKDYYFPEHDNAPLVTKVYSLLSVQLFITFIIGLVMYLHPHYVTEHILAFFWCSVVFSFVTLFAMFCLKGIPKLVTSLIFASMIGIMIGCVDIQYTINSLVQAMVVTFGITTFCSAFVMFTRANLYSWGPMLSLGLWMILLMSLIFVFFPAPTTLATGLTIFGIILFTAYILYDTSMLIHNSSNDTDAYIDIAVNLYLDIINLFLRILELFGERRE